METSLIGKALNFGFNEYGFESHVSKTYTHTTSYLINQIKIGMLNKKIYLITFYTKRILFLVIFLKKIKYINFFYIFKKNNRIFIKIYPFYYKNAATNHFLKIVSKPSKSFFISLKALYLIQKRTDKFNLLLSTDKGLMTHSDAIKKKISGNIFGYFYI